ncbi:LLM class flavin-dependent oxidoreductase [Allokutzneria sp. A3M-2-11 16]|uniref:LLM class flavin-dependent oxidoreductase n=1 Tax=Allokutzneria sp. A3M-2-11 16 TaxID=2962043 RepID=UPI0020B6AF22|nr:LLM class flavin-dependent oxidoreductase [Allokutzneria sp. A3M-2-11 16]MCP3803394.1 LLM class flavin-dependent oxidoreductase [Allokutzneria sp. A3M-2-11 16]
MLTPRFGVLLSSRRDAGQSDADVLARTVALARQAERLGLDEVWVTEHHFLDHVVAPSSLTLAAYLLGATERVRVGTAVTLLPLHSPLHVAEQAALLDHVSGGRFTLGVGRGQPLVEYELIGKGIDRWRDGMADSLAETLNALRGKVSGREDLPVVPLPREDGGPGVYLAANSEDSVRLAAESGVPMLLYFDKSPDVKALMIEDYRRNGGPEEADHAFALYTVPTDDPGVARRLMRERAAVMFSGQNRHRHLIPVTHEPPTGDELERMVERHTDQLLDTHAVGDVETCVRRLAHNIERSGCTRVLCQVEIDGHTASAAWNLDRLATEVLPEVAKRLAVHA